MPDWLNAILLGIIEGATEFIPVSSTGHLLLSQRALGLTSRFWDAFTVMIQLGAILSVVVIYFQRLWEKVVALPTDPSARRFALCIIIGFLPAAVIGLAAHRYLVMLFGFPQLICITLILGGFVLIALDRWSPTPRHTDPMNLPLGTAIGIGFIQCIAFIPGVSRSGATIVGGLAMGLDRRAAAEFSFFLAIPTMIGAFVFDFFEYRDVISSGQNAVTLAIGFVVSFLVGLLAVKAMIGFIARRGYGLFGWWRILVGVVGLLILYALPQ